MTGAPPNPSDIIDLIDDIFERRGAEAYAGETLTVAEHMLQTAALAQAEGAPETLIAAALLHDIGHFTGEFGAYTPTDTEDKHHDASGAKVLENYFPPAVTECIRLHVAAKRYLCATDPTYTYSLSPASKHSLALQGGPMTEPEIAAFHQHPFHAEAIKLRRWDDSGKIEGLPTTTFAAYKPLLQKLLIP